MNKKSAFVCALLVSVVANAQAAESARPAWKSLFNGKDLRGWSAHYASNTAADESSAAQLFRVENGEIHAYRDEAAGTEQPYAYLLSDTDYKDYRLSLEYKWGEKKFAPRADQIRDAGFLYHVYKSTASSWPGSVEAQIQEGDVGDAWAVSSQVSSFIDPKTKQYALPEKGGVPVTVGRDGGFERIRHGRVN